MPPNFKFPTAAQLALVHDEHDLMDAESHQQNTNATSGSHVAPPPLTLDADATDDNETFFFHDIEANGTPDNPKVDNDELEPMEEQQENLDSTNREHHQNHYQQQHHHRVIKHLASQINDVHEISIDARRLSRAVRDAGEFSYGVIACEVWILNDEDKLERPQGGWWHNSKLYQCSQQSMLLNELEVTEPEPILPGVDLPGILWRETASPSSDGDELQSGLSSQKESLFARNGSTDDLADTHFHRHHHPPHSTSHRSTGTPAETQRNQSLGQSLVCAGQSMEGLVHLALHRHHHPHSLFWRDLHSIAEDPDSSKTPRLQQLIKAGLGVAAGISFHVRNQRGLVIYYARTHTRTHLISNVANDAYLEASAQMIAHAAALSEIRRASVEARRRYNKDASERFRRNLIDNRKKTADNPPNDFACFELEDGSFRKCALDDNNSITAIEDDYTGAPKDLPPDSSSLLDQCLSRFLTWYSKCKGGNLQVPPALTLRQSLWTVFGSFCGLLVLSLLNEYYKILSNEDYFLLIGPFGALMTLQYGLTAAPASQPRNVVLGQTVSGAVSLAFTYIPESILAVWLRRAVGPAVAIGVMVKFGFTHPPAGAHAVLYASGKYNFGFYALVVLSSAVSVIPATIVNNMSTKRQYPTYWTFFKLPKRGEGEPAKT